MGVTHLWISSGSFLGGADKNVVVFDKSSEQILATLKGHTKKVTSVVFHPSQVKGSASHPGVLLPEPWLLSQWFRSWPSYPVPCCVLVEVNWARGRALRLQSGHWAFICSHGVALYLVEPPRAVAFRPGEDLE